jgi:SAM-dependent methyltransferase
VVFWGDIPAGLAELRRVLRPGGCLVVAFHSRNVPTRRARRIGLPEDAAARIQAAMGSAFSAATRHDLEHLTGLAGSRSGPAVVAPLIRVSCWICNRPAERPRKGDVPLRV